MNIVLQPQGNLDVKVAALLVQKMAALISENYTHYFIDLAQVKSLNHCGVNALFAAQKLARKTGKRLSLCNLNSTVHYILEISDLNGQFEILESNDDFLEIRTKIVV